MTEAELPSKVNIYRLSVPQHTSLAQELDYSSCFIPSSQDKTSNPVSISAWDSRKTTAAQAFDLSGGNLKSNSKLFSVVIGELQKIAEKYENILKVVPDLISVPDLTTPGALGHVGILGLDRPKGFEKQKWKKMLNEMFAKLIEVKINLPELPPN